MEVKILRVLENAREANNVIAGRNQMRLDKLGILAINIMSSPGAGKTSLILQTIDRLKEKFRIAVVEGDLASSVDADKVHEQGVPAVQINTDGGCHLNANMLESALDNLALPDIDLLFIENVGNLVCPAGFILGEHKRVMLLSLPEGDDKPYKYPLMFSGVDVVLINKIDFLPHLDFNLESFRTAVAGINSRARIFQVSCKTGEGIDQWLSWLMGEIKMKKGAHY